MKTKFIKILCVILALAAFAFMAIGSGSDDEDPASKVGEISDDKTPDSDKSDDKTPDSDKSDDNKQNENQQTTQKEYKVGETLVTKDIKVTFLSSGEFISDNMFTQPADGNKYVYIKLYCENISSSDQNISYYDFNCYADGYACDGCYSMDNTLSATLSSGRTTTGTVCFEVPANATDIEFEYEANIWTSAKYTFIYEGIKDSGIVPSNDVKATEGAYKVGDIIESKTERITYLACGEYTSDNMFLQPKDGYKYIYLEFEFENISSSDENVSSLYFRCFADGAACESHYLGDDELSATLSAGRKTKGKVYFEVPKAATIIEAEYESSFWSSKKITFTYSE